MILCHYSPKPLVIDRSRHYIQSDHDMKPRGLWLSVENDYGWREWCENNDYSISSDEGSIYKTEFVLRDDANILHLTSVEDIDRFTDRFKNNDPRRSYHCIDWTPLPQLYQGIIISPYQWERRLSEHTLWYYGWDCASGCVWDCSILQVVSETRLKRNA